MWSYTIRLHPFSVVYIHKQVKWLAHCFLFLLLSMSSECPHYVRRFTTIFNPCSVIHIHKTVCSLFPLVFTMPGGGVTFSMPYFLTTRLYPCSITHTDKLVKHLAHIFYYLYIFRVLKSLCRLSLLYEPLYSPSLSLSPIPTTPLMAHCFLCFFCFQFRNFFHLSLAVN